jgi:deoxyribose-phosphate aldolase
MEIAKYIEHTNLKPYASFKDIEKLCKEAVEYGFYSVCINPAYINLARKLLIGKNVKIVTVVGFPLGSNNTQIKVYEALNSIDEGADEIDMVINISALKDGKTALVKDEILRVKQICKERVLKVIIETCYLEEEEIKTAVKLCIEAGADFVKTSTGFGTRGANIRDIEIIKEVADGKIKIKASGGIKDFETALNFIKTGVERLGTSSSIDILLKKYGGDSY